MKSPHIICCCPISVLSNNDNKASLKVVHKHGPCSKLSQDKTIAAPTHTEILLQDQSRVKSIHSRLSNPKPSGGNDVKVIDATTIPAKDGSVVGSGNYIVTVGLGTPLKELSLICIVFLAYIDTANHVPGIRYKNISSHPLQQFHTLSLLTFTLSRSESSHFCLLPLCCLFY